MDLYDDHMVIFKIMIYIYIYIYYHILVGAQVYPSEKYEFVIPWRPPPSLFKTTPHDITHYHFVEDPHPDYHGSLRLSCVIYRMFSGKTKHHRRGLSPLGTSWLWKTTHFS